MLRHLVSMFLTRFPGCPLPTYHKYIHLSSQKSVVLNDYTVHACMRHWYVCYTAFQVIVKLMCLGHIFLAPWWTCFTSPRHTFPVNFSRHFRISQACQQHTFARPFLILLFQCITTAIGSMAVYVSIAVLGAALFWVNKTFIMASSHTLLPHTHRSSSTYEDDTLPPKPTGQVRPDSLYSCELSRSSSAWFIKQPSEVYRSSSLR